MYITALSLFRQAEQSGSGANPQKAEGAPPVRKQKSRFAFMRNGSLVLVGRTGIEPATR
jgi:hypothetical protein